MEQYDERKISSTSGDSHSCHCAAPAIMVIAKYDGTAAHPMASMATSIGGWKEHGA